MEHPTGYGKPKDNADYVAFLQEKTPIASFDGFDIEDSDIHPILKPHQRACVKWAVKGGNRALFEAFGLGKSVQQVEIVRIIMVLAGGRIRGFLSREEATEERIMELATATDRALIEQVLPQLAGAS